ncbi:hypothetical protein Sjap_002440 [Stephania japonica]|uniref:Transposase n=1 Tax=Stephania japonica TaxID=461633 RepID=A0AAP0PU63_9MAGN
MEPPDVHEIPIRLIANDTELHPSHFCARRMTKVFKRWMIPEGYCWKSVPPHHKDKYWRHWKVFFRWDDTIPEDLIRAAYDRLAGIRYTALMHKLKKKRVQPVYVIDEAWRRYLEYWESEDFLARSSQATADRNTEVKGPGTGPSKHSGGSMSFVTTQERLNDSSETPPTVNELYLYLHTVNHDRMTFIDTRSERFYDRLQRRCQELTQATPDQSVDDEAVYLNVAGECPKGRVYGLGSLGRKKRRYADPSASTSEMPDMVPRAEFNVVASNYERFDFEQLFLHFKRLILQLTFNSLEAFSSRGSRHYGNRQGRHLRMRRVASCSVESEQISTNNSRIRSSQLGSSYGLSQVDLDFHPMEYLPMGGSIDMIGESLKLDLSLHTIVSKSKVLVSVGGLVF